MTLWSTDDKVLSLLSSIHTKVITTLDKLKRAYNWRTIIINAQYYSLVFKYL